MLLGAISEPVVGAAVVRSYGVEDRTQARIDTAIQDWQDAYTHAQTYTVTSFSLGGLSAGLANAGVIVIGVLLGFTGDMTPGRVLAFAFLVTLFVGPVQMGTQILTDAQNAIASWRRVLGILETPADLDRPGGRRRGPPAGSDRRPLRRRQLRLPRRAAGAPRGRPGHRRRHPGGDRGGDRLGQVHLRQAAHPPDGPDRRRRAARRRRRTPHRGAVAAAQRRARAAGGLPLRRLDRGQRALRQARRHRGRDPRLGGRARHRRLAARPPARAPHPGGPARRVAVGRRAAARRAAARAPRRPRPPGPRRGHQRRRPGAGDADRPRPRAADAVADVGHHRAPAVHGRERRRGDRGRQGTGGAAGAAP